ncbi:MAG: MBL fold metallo-hydrolase [Candidatus Paceibacterota bacterium]
MVKVTTLGGSSGLRSIGPSCYVVDIDDKRIIVDCGIEPTLRGFIPPNLDYLRDGKLIDAVCLTHGHVDHIAYTPALIPFMKPDAKVFMTPQTAQTSSYVIEEQFKFGIRVKDLPFSMLDMFEFVQERISIIERPGVIEILDGISAYAHPVGHIPGACGFIFKLPDGRKMMISGDMSWHNQPTVLGYQPMPDEWKPEILAGIDLTGVTVEKNPSWELEADRMGRDVREVMENGGSVAIAAFANNKSQCVVSALHQRGVTSYMEEGSAATIARILSRNKWSDNDVLFDLGQLKMIEDFHHRRYLMGQKEPKVVTSPSGMCIGGHIREWLEVILPDPNAALFFAGFVAEDSNGGRIINAKEQGKEEVTLVDNNGFGGEMETLPLRCRIGKYKLTSHGDGQSIFNWIEQIDPQIINLTHGTPAGKLYAASRLLKRNRKIFMNVGRHKVRTTREINIKVQQFALQT